MKEMFEKIWSEENINKYVKICFWVILIGTVYLVVVPPYIGIANNGDFHRFSYKFGVYYTNDLYDPGNYVHNVIEKFAIGTPQDTDFFSSYEVVGWISRLICLLFSKTGQYDIRYMGIASAGLILVAVKLLFHVLKPYSRWLRAGIATLAVIVLLDSHYVQYYNSFFCEQGFFVFGLFFTVFFIMTCNRFSYFRLLLEIVSALLLALVKSQYMVVILPCMLMIVMQQFFYYKFNKKKLVIVLLALLSAMFIPKIASQNVDPTSFGALVHYNTIMQRLLRLSDNPEEHLERMGFCQDEIVLIKGNIGNNAFSNTFRTDYPDITAKFTLKAEAKILLHEPSLLYKSMADIQGYLYLDEQELGNFVSADFADMQGKAFPLNYWLMTHLFCRNYVALFVCMFFTAGVAFYRWKKGNVLALFMIGIPVSVVIMYVVVAVGDACEEGKHLYAVNILSEIAYFYLFFRIAAAVLYGMKQVKAYMIGK